MVLHNDPSDRDVIPANEAWTAIFHEQQSGSGYQSSSHVSSMHLSRESYDTISKEATFSDGTRSTHFDDEGYSVGYSVYDSDDLSSHNSREMTPPPKQKKAPAPEPVSEPTVFMLQHHIPSPKKKEDRVEEARDVATREEQETPRDEPMEEPAITAPVPEKEKSKKKEAKSFARFRKQFGGGKKKKAGDVEKSSRDSPPKEDPTLSEPEPSKPKQSEAKPSLRSKGFLLSRRQSSKSLTKENERTASLSKLEAVSSTESEEDDRDSSTDGGSTNSDDSDPMNRDDESIDEAPRETDRRGKNRRRSSGRGASTVAATAASRSRDDLSVGMTDEEKSVRSSKSGRSIKSNRSSKSGRSIKSNRSSRSIRSLKGILKRKSRDGKTDENSLEDTDGGSKKIRRKRSWIPMRRRRSSKKNEPSKTMKKPKKSILRKRGTPNSKTEFFDKEAPVEEVSPWEAFYDNLDGFCCRPLFGEEEEQPISDDEDRSRTPSEIYINTESSKTLVTV